MSKDINITIRRLLVISRNVIDEIGILTALSYQDKENTSEYDEHIKKIATLFNTEAVIINNLTEEELLEIAKLLPKYDDGTYIYDRTYITIDSRIEELQLNDEETAENIEAIEDITFDEEMLKNDIYSYFIEDEDTQKYDTLFTNYINVFALKRISDRINNTIVYNQNDARYKRRLLNYLKVFKYVVLSQNPQMEKLGLKSRFNLAKMPYLEEPNIDASTISYNHCVAIIDHMYNPPESKDDIGDTMIELFNMICFESYLRRVDNTELERLTELCDNLRVRAKNQFYGDIAKYKILTKKLGSNS